MIWSNYCNRKRVKNKKKKCIEVLNIPGPRANKNQKIYGQIKSILKNILGKIYD